MQTTTEIRELLEKYLSDRMTRTERLRFKALLQESSNNEEMAAIINIVLREQRYQDTPTINKDILFRNLMEKATPNTPGGPVAAVYRIRFLKTAWFRYAAAIIICLGTGLYLYTINQKKTPTLANNNKYLETDIAPGGQKAILTLADGSKIILDSAANGKLASQGDVKIVKRANGQIEYDAGELTVKDVLWNTMNTPVGGQYQLTLPDGTKAWLNAASSITFPTAFNGEKREVKIYGEVYFEVARNNGKPFIVDVNGKSVVEVLGTNFNINSYWDEGGIRTALSEGSVKVIYGDQTSVLKPGFQAVITFSDQPPASGDSAIQIQPAHLDQALAWKNGLFSFNDADLRSVMRELERWYDINVQYKGAVPAITLKGKMYRNVNLSAVLDFLQRMGVDVRMEGKTLIVI